MQTAAAARFALVAPLALLLLGCPTRPAPKADAADDMSSDSDQDGSGAAGAGGKAATGSGGRAGAGSGLAGAGGLTGAGGGLAGAGGAAGSSAGIAGGAGGMAGNGGGVKDGQPCSLAADCASKVCTPFYVDVDGDGYGTGQAMGFCGTMPPIGYATQSGDCCDTATNLAVAKLIHPGADFQTTSAGGICGITWDYDCSGQIEKNRMDCTSCTQNPCSCVDADYPDSDCGTSQAGVSCSLAGAPTSTCQKFAGGVGVVTCR